MGRRRKVPVHELWMWPPPARPRPFVHLYFDPGRSRRFTSFKPGIPSCWCCGSVKPRDPAQINGCRGVARVELRDGTDG